MDNRKGGIVTNLHFALELAVVGVIFDHPHHLLRADTGIIDSNHFSILNRMISTIIYKDYRLVTFSTRILSRILAVLLNPLIPILDCILFICGASSRGNCGHRSKN